jgi:hypothetical protein
MVLFTLIHMSEVARWLTKLPRELIHTTSSCRVTILCDDVLLLFTPLSVFFNQSPSLTSSNIRNNGFDRLFLHSDSRHGILLLLSVCQFEFPINRSCCWSSETWAPFILDIIVIVSIIVIMFCTLKHDMFKHDVLVINELMSLGVSSPFANCKKNSIFLHRENDRLPLSLRGFM